MLDLSAETLAGSGDEAGRFLKLLVQHGLMIPTSALGVYGRGAVFRRVVEAAYALVGRLSPPGAESIEFPPVMDRHSFQATRYLANFPHLAGVVHCFCGDNDGHARLLQTLAAGGDWAAELAPSDVVLTPAACYPVYGMVGARGPLPDDGLFVDASSWCFRHEPSSSPVRMLAFRQREQVCLGIDEHVQAFQTAWKTRAMEMFRALRLPAEYRPAQDPFFGRLGGLVAQRQQGRLLKHEILVPIVDPERPDACGSFNQHGDHFARAFGVRTADGETARTACAGFGLERLALALFRHHGFRPEAWPVEVRRTLWPDR